MIETILSATILKFTPILLLMLIDLVTGIAKSLQSHSIKSAKLRNSLNKCVIYFVVLLIGGCLSVFGEESISIIFFIFLCCIEGISILENLQILFPKLKFLKTLSKYLDDKKSEKINDK